MSAHYKDLVENYPIDVIRGEHPAFNFGLLNKSEIDLRSGKFIESIRKFDAWIRSVHDNMRSFRAGFEKEWIEAEQEYNLTDERRQDAGRDASAFMIDPDNIDGDEFGRERASIALPVGYEMTEQTGARYYEVFFGSDQDRFVEIRGRERNDDPGSETVEDWMNFQQGYQINTPRAGLGWCRDACVYGTGIMAQLWDFEMNRRTMKNVSIWDLLFDPAAHEIDECRYTEWRQWITVKQALDMRDKEKFAFTDEAFEASLEPEAEAQEAEQEPQEIQVFDKKADNDYRRIPLDIFMQKKRWVYRLGGKLIVAIAENQVPPVMFTGEDGESRIVAETYPLHVFTPIPGLLMRNKRRSVYGLSHLTLGKPIIDLMNSILFLMNENLARSALGVLFADTDSLGMANANMQMEAGKLYPCRDPKNNILQIDFKDVAPQCLEAMGVLNVWIERLHGVNDSVRGQHTGASKTATQARQDLGEATMRLKTGIWMGINSVRQIYDVGLRLNQAYVEPDQFTRVVGEAGVKTPINRETLANVSGIDLMPTGFPQIGSRAQAIEQGTNTIGLITQSQAQGVQGLNPKPLIRQVLKAQGWKNVDQIVGKDIRPGQSADDENEFILQGIPVEVGPNDNHVRHGEIHDTLWEHPDARELFKREPMILQAFEEHLTVHARFRDAMEPPPEESPGGEEGPGAGIAGTNTELIAPRTKPAAELEAQMTELTT